ncbi:DEAD/DEAH box helicase [Arthrobacter sp. NEB 688]|uniref:DEAD/DEAH box helicase n=1 Tax=Arthrobacter sp. NEB 688 TaxID=904039 RepID=UPI0015677E75|nr:DEAD/DEAH box helicase [Arthrobacter sp. NEB 688]QKE85442.1 DEAD/DEAH box helicase [Arthrobacter sp. NEB 688]
MPKKVTGPKARWTAAQKAEAQKGPKKPHRGQPARSTDTADRPKRPRAERSPRWDREDPRRGDRPARSDRREGLQREDRPRRFERDERPARFQRDDRPRRDDRGPRDERPARFQREDRPARFERDDRPRRDDRGPRDERPARFQRDERPARFQREDRPARFERDDRPRRDDRGQRDERPQRFERDDRPRRDDRFQRDERPQRDDRPRRWVSGDGEERRVHRPHDERPRRERGDRPFRERSPRVADPVRRDRHEGRHVEQPRSFEDAEAERAEADTWTAYRSVAAGGPREVTEDNGFAALGLPERLVERLARDGIAEPFPIQAATIPDALAGRDVLGRGRTGSGKTLAFGLPTIARLSDGVRPEPRRPRALVLVPTRELAMQVSDALEPFIHVTGLKHRLVAGGLSYEGQISALNRGVHLLVATPGRLVDLMERGAVELGAIEVAILDEADHMADMGFVPEVTAILDAVPEGGQRLLFSATLDRGVDSLVEKYLVDPVTHSTDDAQAAVTTMSHHVLLIDPQDKKALTAELCSRPGRTVVFARTQLGAERIARELRERGVLAAALHGGLSQGVRNRVLGAFRDGRVPVLVATDVAARGIHVDDIGMVVQVDPPTDHKDYLHRAGRTARAGEEGAVVMLALPHQRKMVTRIIEGAGAEAQVAKVAPGDATVTALGGVAPTGVPVPDEVWRPLLEAKPQGRGRGGPHRGGPHRGGPRGGRPQGGARSGGRPSGRGGRMGA